MPGNPRLKVIQPNSDVGESCVCTAVKAKTGLDQYQKFETVTRSIVFLDQHHGQADYFPPNCVDLTLDDSVEVFQAGIKLLSVCFGYSWSVWTA